MQEDQLFRQDDVVDYALIRQATDRYMKVIIIYLFEHVFSVGYSYFSIFYRYSEWPLAGRSWVRNPVTERFYRTSPDELRVPHSFIYNGCWVFHGVKVAGA